VDDFGNDLGVPLKPYQERVRLEKVELDLKIEKLTDFVTDNQIFDDLPDADKMLLVDQLLAMDQYSEMLRRRIERF
jgi:hypothetical protein